MQDDINAVISKALKKAGNRSLEEASEILYNAMDKIMEGDMDSHDILTIKGLIRRGEARTASTYNQIPLNRVHFLDLHVLSTPPAFILSQDQTLMLKLFDSCTS